MALTNLYLLTSKVLLFIIHWSQFSESGHGNYASISTVSFGPHHMVSPWKCLFCGCKCRLRVKFIATFLKYFVSFNVSTPVIFLKIMFS